jgi:hypothetical protein
MATDRATLGINTEPFRRGLEEARAQAAAFGGHVKRDFSGIGAQIAAAFTIGAAVSFFKTISGELDRLAKLAQRFAGETAESIQRVEYAGDKAGANIEQIASAMTKAIRAAVEAEKGNEAYAQTFAELGLSAAEFLRLSLEDKILALSKAYTESRDKGAALNNIIQLLGKSGAEMIPLLASGPEAIKETYDEAATASEATAKAAEKVNDSFTRTWNTLKKSLSPAIIFLGQVAASTMNVIQVAIVGVTGMLMGLTAAASKAMRGNLAEASRILDDYSKATGATTRTLIEQTRDMWQNSGDGSSAEVNQEKIEAEIEATERLQDLTKKVADAERKAAYERLSIEEKLLRTRIDIAKATQEKNGSDQEAAMNARLRLVDLEKEEVRILGEIQKQEDAIRDRREKLAEREAQFLYEQKNNADKLFQVKQRIADLEDAVNNTDIEEEKLRLEEERLDLKMEEKKLTEAIASEERRRMEDAQRLAERNAEKSLSFTGVGAVGSLRSLGGGGGVEVSDPARAMVREQQKAVEELKEIKRILKDGERDEAV